MSKENQQPSREATQPPATKIVLRSANTQAQKTVIKPDKNARVPEYQLKCFSCGEKEK